MLPWGWGERCLHCDVAFFKGAASAPQHRRTSSEKGFEAERHEESPRSLLRLVFMIMALGIIH